MPNVELAGPPTRPIPVSEYSFARAVAELFRSRKSGALTVKLRNLYKVIVVVDGSPVYAESNIAEESLGATLVRRGEADETKIYAAQAKAISSGRHIGDILVEKNVLTPEALLKAMRRSYGACILGAFRWSEGELSFDANPPEVDDKVCLRMSPSMLVLRGVAVYAPFDQVDSQFVKDVLDRYQLRPGARDHAADHGLNTTEQRVFDLLSEPRTIDGLAQEAGVTHELITRLLYALSLLNIVATPEQVARGERAPEPQKIVVVAEPGQGDPLSAAEASRIDAEYLACKSQDHFSWLGVMRETDSDSLRRAFIRRSENFSPGTFKGRDLGDHRERFEAIYLALNHAYFTLSDATRRGVYIDNLERRVEQRRRTKTESAEIGRFDTNTLLRAGKKLADNGKHADALRFFEEVLDDQPHHVGALERLGYSLYLSAPQEFMRAVRYLQEAMAMEPDSGEPYYYLGLVYEAKEDAESARHAFNECLRRQSGHAGATAGLGRIPA
jgi:tetratricopeptide (TPR) repeat protein